MANRVYIVQDLGRINFEPAQVYGQTRVVVPGQVSNAAIPLAYKAMRKTLAHISSLDWLVPTGHPALIALAGALMIEKTGMLRMLAWDAQQHCYNQVEVENVRSH